LNCSQRKKGKYHDTRILVLLEKLGYRFGSARAATLPTLSVVSDCGARFERQVMTREENQALQRLLGGATRDAEEYLLSRQAADDYGDEYVRVLRETAQDFRIVSTLLGVHHYMDVAEQLEARANSFEREPDYSNWKTE
jgi:hypothetical protein